MTEREQDRLIDRILDRCDVEIFKYEGCRDIDLVKIGNRYKEFRTASEADKAEILRIAKIVFQSVWPCCTLAE